SPVPAAGEGENVRVAWVLIVCALGGAARAEDVPSTLQMRDMAFPVRVFNTPSDLRIVFEEDHSQPIVSDVTIIDAGSSVDTPGKEGLAHVDEHLAGRGRPDGKTSVTEIYRRAGLGDWNATTTHDLVMYWSVGGRESLGEMLTVEGPRIVAPLIGVDA